MQKYAKLDFVFKLIVVRNEFVTRRLHCIKPYEHRKTRKPHNLQDVHCVGRLTKIDEKDAYRHIARDGRLSILNFLFSVK